MAPHSKAEKSKAAHPALLSFLSGSIAGGVEASITYPIEFAKTRVQLRKETGTATRIAQNPFLVIHNVVRQEGVRALYTGWSALVVGSVAKDGIRFLTFDTIKSAFRDPDTGVMTPTRSLLAGMSAGLVSSTFASTPTERIKVALIDDARTSKRFRSARDALRILYNEQGFLGLWRGFASTTLRQSCSTAIRMGTYNVLKDYEASQQYRQGVSANFANGAVAGLITTLATQPFDVVKTRCQSSKGASTIEACRSTLIDDGILGFWRGTSMRLSRTILSAGILFTTYERIVVLLRPVLG